MEAKLRQLVLDSPFDPTAWFHLVGALAHKPRVLDTWLAEGRRRPGRRENFALLTAQAASRRDQHERALGLLESVKGYKMGEYELAAAVEVMARALVKRPATGAPGADLVSRVNVLSRLLPHPHAVHYLNLMAGGQRVEACRLLHRSEGQRAEALKR
jgi:hypothetical protein